MIVSVYVDGVLDVDGTGNAKVDELELALDEQEVCRLEVGVDNVMTVNCGDTFEHLTPVVACEGDVKAGCYGVVLGFYDAREVGVAHFEELLDAISECMWHMKGKDDLRR